jgi:hypothetical protein
MVISNLNIKLIEDRLGLVKNPAAETAGFFTYKKFFRKMCR